VDVGELRHDDGRGISATFLGVLCHHDTAVQDGPDQCSGSAALHSGNVLPRGAETGVFLPASYFGAPFPLRLSRACLGKSSCFTLSGFPPVFAVFVFCSILLPQAGYSSFAHRKHYDYVGMEPTALRVALLVFALISTALLLNQNLLRFGPFSDRCQSQ
jgi:hypothetical protein